MKIKFIIPSLLIALFLLSGCEKNFDPEIYGVFSTENFPYNEDDVQGLVMFCYRPFQAMWSYDVNQGLTSRSWYSLTGGNYKFFDGASDLMAPWLLDPWGQGWSQISAANYENCINWPRWGNDDTPNAFEKIREITLMTSVIGSIESSYEKGYINENVKTTYVAETRLLRGLTMYFLFHTYGPVPVLLDPAETGIDEAVKNLVRPSLEEMVGYITDDLKYAAENMTNANSSTRGRYTKDYANFCLMHHYLNEGEVIDGYYQKAIDVYENELIGAGYSLIVDGDDPYAEVFSPDNEFNQEIIMAISINNPTGSGALGSFNMMAAYTTPNNVFRSKDTLVTPFTSRTGYFRQAFNISREFYNTFDTLDSRRTKILSSYYSRIDKRIIDSNDIGIKWDGYIMHKYPETDGDQYPITDVPLARWSDVLLMYAEAVARNTNAVPSAGILDETVNAVRSRAGLEALSGAAIASYDGFMDALLMERGHELYFEGCRKIDLIRFNKYRTNCKLYKGETPTRQYVPIPDYAVREAEDYGHTLVQYFERPNFSLDN